MAQWVKLVILYYFIAAFTVYSISDLLPTVHSKTNYSTFCIAISIDQIHWRTFNDVANEQFNLAIVNVLQPLRDK